jgi:hypothetical protein
MPPVKKEKASTRGSADLGMKGNLSVRALLERLMFERKRSFMKYPGTYSH